jgi:hypothetical protein
MTYTPGHLRDFASNGKPTNGLPRLALTRQDARSLGLSLDSFKRYVQPEVRLVRRGRLRLVPVRELHAWLERNVARPLIEEIEVE